MPAKGDVLDTFFSHCYRVKASDNGNSHNLSRQLGLKKLTYSSSIAFNKHSSDSSSVTFFWPPRFWKAVQICLLQIDPRKLQHSKSLGWNEHRFYGQLMKSNTSLWLKSALSCFWRKFFLAWSSRISRKMATTTGFVAISAVSVSHSARILQGPFSQGNNCRLWHLTCL